jgi:phosphonate transport system substrate-binding protein
MPAYATAARKIGERLGRPAELIVAADYSRCGADLDHVCFVCSVPYLLLSAAGGIEMEVLAAPILRGSRYRGQPVYFSDVVVRADSPYASFDDLRGTRWAYNEPYSHSGFVVVLYELARLGKGTDFVGQAVEAGFHDEALQMILAGRADWAAIDSQVLALWLRGRPALRRKLRTVAVLGPSTVQPVVASARRLNRRALDAVREALVTLDRDPVARPILHAAGIERFVAIEAGDYEDIRAKLAAVADAGLLPDGWHARWMELSGMARRSRPPSGVRERQAASTIGLTSPIQRSSVSSS